MELCKYIYESLFEYFWFINVMSQITVPLIKLKEIIQVVWHVSPCQWITIYLCIDQSISTWTIFDFPQHLISSGWIPEDSGLIVIGLVRQIQWLTWHSVRSVSVSGFFPVLLSFFLSLLLSWPHRMRHYPTCLLFSWCLAVNNYRTNKWIVFQRTWEKWSELQ